MNFQCHINKSRRDEKCITAGVTCGKGNRISIQVPHGTRLFETRLNNTAPAGLSKRIVVSTVSYAMLAYGYLYPTPAALNYSKLDKSFNYKHLIKFYHD